MQKLNTTFEILAVSTLILVQIWIVGASSIWPASLALFAVILGWTRRKEGFERLGLLNWKLALVFTAIFLWRESNFIVLGLEGIPNTAVNLARYYSWAVFQQLILNGFFALRIREICPDDKRAAFWTGIVFALFHLPNPLLTIITFTGGVAASYVFLRMTRRNIYLLALAHVAVGIVIKYGLPYSWHYNLVVGPRFFLL